MTIEADQLTAAIREGLRLLGIRRLVLAIHDASFPSIAAEDIGRGSPYGAGGGALLEFARALGFNGLQFGPQGDTSFVNPSPYDGALFTKSPMSIALATLVEDPDFAPLCAGLLGPAVAARGSRGAGDRVDYRHAWRTARDILSTIHDRFRSDPVGHGALAARFAAFRLRRQATLTADGDFEALTSAHGTDDWRRWPPIEGKPVDQWLHCAPAELTAAANARRATLHTEAAADIERHAFGQFVLAEQHMALRRAAAGASGDGGIALYGDLQIGISHRDLWSRRNLFLTDYLMGAPPSRTNPLGQPWGYPVLDPTQYSANGGPSSAGGWGPAMNLLMARIDGMLDSFDGIRIDHPHGLVCPWVYAASDSDPAAAVGRGGRLFCSPNLSDHPGLAELAIPVAEQLSADPAIARYADDWVRQLDAPQVARYGVLFDALIARVAARGRQPADVVCEVLSTWPHPLRAVMGRHGLGRFCVTQKGDLTRADDVYRSENASEHDWIMVGNHDTPPIWQLTAAWHGSAVGAERAAYLASRLIPQPTLRAQFGRWLASDGRHLGQAMFGDLFASRARNVSVFFADLFGLKEIYNLPGVVDDANWTLRLPSDFQGSYADRLKEGAAMNVPLALAFGLIARLPPETAGHDRPRHVRAVRSLLAWARRLSPSLGTELETIIEAIIDSPASTT